MKRPAHGGIPRPLAPASYARISSSDDDLGVRRQKKENAERAERAGWPRPAFYVDNDVSAYSGRPRPDYQRLVDDIHTGAVDGLVVWHFDRLYRSPKELEALIDLLDERPGFPIIAVTAGDIDLSTASGRMMARTLTNIARYESEHKAERVRSKHRELAESGRVSGGGTRPFGFGPDRLIVRADEAALIAEARDRVFTGETLWSIVNDWNARDVPTVTGTPWTSTVLRRVLTSGRVCGWREHHGEFVAKAEWPPILDRSEVERLRIVLLDPSRRTCRDGGRRYLLTGGIARCDLCGAPLVARPRAKGRPCYVCAKGPGFRGCGAIRILGADFEDWVLEAVACALEGPELHQRLVQESAEASESEVEVSARIGLVEDRAKELAGDWASGRIRRDEWHAARDVLEAERRSLHQELRRTSERNLAAGYVGSPTPLREAWAELSQDRRRSIINAVIAHVRVGPAIRGQNFFNSQRLAIEWRV